MSHDKKYPHEVALEVALFVQAALQPFVEQIKIAGSLRRGKVEVGDVELLFIPRIELRQKDFFSSDPIDLASETIGQMLANGVLQKRPSETGVFSWGAKNKLAIHTASGIPVDLFSTTAENWFVSLVIRTGSKETNLRLTTGAQRQNATLNAYGCGVTWSDGTMTPAKSEEDVFKMCGVPYLPPEKR